MANYLRTPDFAGQTMAAQGNIVKSAALAEQGRRDDRYSNALAQAYQGTAPQSYGGFEGTQIESIQQALAGASEQHRDMMMSRVNLLDYITQNVNPMNYAQMAGAAKQAMPDLQVPETFEEYQQVAPQLQNQVNMYKAAFGEQEKPPAPTDLEKMHSYLDSLPKDSPRRAEVQQAIDKKTRQSGGVIVHPDGTVQVGGAPLSGATENKVQQMILANDQALQHLGEISQKFKPQYLEYAGRLGASWSQIKDRMGVLDPESEDALYLQEYSDFAAATGEHFAKTLKEMSGGAVTDAEAVRQEVWLPNAEKDGPVAFKHKMKRSIAFVEAANARLHHAMENGLTKKQMYAIPLEAMPTNEKQETGQADIEQLVQKYAD